MCISLHQHLVLFYDCSSLFPVLLFHLENWWNAEKEGRRIRGRKRRERGWEGKRREREDHTIRSIASTKHLNWETCGVKKLPLLPKPNAGACLLL